MPELANLAYTILAGLLVLAFWTGRQSSRIDRLDRDYSHLNDTVAKIFDKLDKLKAFIETSPVFKNLHADERGRLSRQFDVMAEYSNILSQRIAAFP